MIPEDVDSDGYIDFLVVEDDLNVNDGIANTVTIYKNIDNDGDGISNVQEVIDGTCSLTDQYC